MRTGLPNTDDDELVRLARGGSEAAMVTLYERYRPRIMGYAYRMFGDISRAEDVFQNTFFYFFEHLHRYEPQGKLGAYLLKIARSMGLKEMEAVRRAQTADAASDPYGAFAPASAEKASPRERAEAAELESKARRAVLDLSPALREILVLRLYEGLEYGEIREITGIPEATARSRMRYALEALRAKLGSREAGKAR